jgi:hypothetical protein
MTLVLKPTARYMILCDEVVTDERWPGKPVIVGLVSLIRWPVGSTEPFTLPKLCVYLVLTDGRGKGRVRVSCVNEETGHEVFSSPERTLSFEGKDPSGLYGVVCRLTDCRFPQPGVYVVRFLFAEQEVDHRLVHVR